MERILITKEGGRTSRLGTGAFVSFMLLSVALFLSPANADEISDYIEATVGQALADDLFLGKGSNQVSVTFLGETSSWELDAVHSPTVKQGTILVKGEGSWHLSVASDTGGYMVESDDSGYLPSGRRLHIPLSIIAEGGNRVDLSQGGVLFQGFGQTNIPIIFEQPVSWSDAPLPSGRAYRTSIRFLAYNT